MLTLESTSEKYVAFFNKGSTVLLEGKKPEIGYLCPGRDRCHYIIPFDNWRLHSPFSEILQMPKEKNEPRLNNCHRCYPTSKQANVHGWTGTGH